MEKINRHFHDPCICCNTPHDEVESGPCPGKPRPMSWKLCEVRWDKVARYLVKFTDGEVKEIYSHVSNSLPYYHFGYSDFQHPPEYDPTLRYNPYND